MGSYVAAWFYFAMAVAGAQLVCYSTCKLADLWVAMPPPDNWPCHQCLDWMAKWIGIIATLGFLILGLGGTLVLHYFLGLLPPVHYAARGWPLTSFIVLGLGFLSVLSAAQNLTYDAEKAKKQVWRRT